MNFREKVELLKAIQPSMPGFGAKGALLVNRKIGSLLKGIFVDSSRDPKRFYVQVFVQPLYVPANTLVFNLGWRLGGRAWVKDAQSVSDDIAAAVRVEALPFLSAIETPLDLAMSVIRTPYLAATSPQGQASSRANDPVCMRMRLYSLIYAGKLYDAAVEFDKLKRALTLQFEWENIMLEEASSILQLSTRHPDQALAKFKQWTLETARSLRLDTFATEVG
jgi:hypothetical protein